MHPQTNTSYELTIFYSSISFRPKQSLCLPHVMVIYIIWPEQEKVDTNSMLQLLWSVQTLDGSTDLSRHWCVTHIEMVWGDIHQFLVTWVESLQQHSVSSFTVQADPALWVTHWKMKNVDKWRQNPYEPSFIFNNQTPLPQRIELMTFTRTKAVDV